jgi:MipA family protein
MKGSGRAAGMLCAALWLSWPGAARCVEAESADSPVASAEPAAPLPAARPEVEGAVALMVTYGPEFQGASAYAPSFTPGLFIRYGRFSISSISGFVTRKDADVVRGLAADLLNTEQLRVNFGLRIDRGRDSSDSAALTGIEDARTTLRGRLLVSRALGDGWSASIRTSGDLLGRGGGWLFDTSISKSFHIAPGAAWSWGATISAADQRYMQTYFGVTEAGSAATGYPVYTPSAGLRDASLGVDLRGDISERWVGYVGGSVSRLLGPAQDSPLNTRDTGWTIRLGLAWRF